MSEPLFDNDFLKKLDYLNLIAKRQVFGSRQALHQSMKKGASIEFKDFRNYVHGDDPRSIDWTVFARLDELVVKLFRQEEELDLWILLDNSKSMNFGEPNKFDAARRIAAALAYIGMNNMDSASLLPFAEELTSGRDRMRGRGRIYDLLEFLSSLSSEGGTDLERAVKEFVSRVRRPGLVVIISDFYGLSHALRAIDQLRFFRHQIYVVQSASPWELDPPIRGELRLIDTESGDHADLVVTDSMLRKYRKSIEEFHSELRRYSMEYSIGYSLASTDIPYDSFILDILQRGGLVA